MEQDDELPEKGEREVLCDWCRENDFQGAFFVPGKGIRNLCEHCRVLLMAILVDIL